MIDAFKTEICEGATVLYATRTGSSHLFLNRGKVIEAHAAYIKVAVTESNSFARLPRTVRCRTPNAIVVVG